MDTIDSNKKVMKLRELIRQELLLEQQLAQTRAQVNAVATGQPLMVVGLGGGQVYLTSLERGPTLESRLLSVMAPGERYRWKDLVSAVRAAGGADGKNAVGSMLITLLKKKMVTRPARGIYVRPLPPAPVVQPGLVRKASAL